jgi:ubiquinone/menaquinone biosynthesis C-methylase UbiE
MADHVGLTVLHPGGLKATRRLAESCHLSEHTRVIDIACGKGTGATYLAQTYGCEVVGVDISESLIAQATALAKQKGLEGKVSFRVGDAHDLSFLDDEFDAAISQAMLVLVEDKQKVVEEALRVTKPGGYLGWLELSWRKQPTAEFLGEASDVLCAICMQNVETFQDWEQLFRQAGVSQLETQSFVLERNGLSDMLANEGLVNTGRVMLKRVTNAQIGKRMSTLNGFFKDHPEFFGYGIYVGRSNRSGDQLPEIAPAITRPA